MVEDQGEAKTVEVDPQGRMVLPWRLRERLGLKKGGRVSIKLEDSTRAIIETKTSKNVEDKVENWVNTALNTKVRAFVELGKGKHQTKTSTKWISSDYARRKIGLRKH